MLLQPQLLFLGYLVINFFDHAKSKKRTSEEERKPVFSFNTPSRPVLPKSDSEEGVAMLEPWHLK